MTIQIVEMTPDRAALKAMEAADAHAEACRQDWMNARERQEIFEYAGPDIIWQAAINYAQAANAAHEARERYSDLVMDAMEIERLREGIEGLAV